MTATELRFHLPKKALKADCPDCSPRHRKTLSLYVDDRTNEPLPDIYGRCDRESKCGYHLSPYQKDASGMSYASMSYEQWKADNPMQTHQPGQRRGLIHNRPKPVTTPPVIYTIPDEVFTASIGHYDRNQFARLLRQQFGLEVANQLLNRFQIGTSSRWPGACVFWNIDEKGRKRGGQVKLFGLDWHAVKFRDKKAYTWIHAALTYRLKQSGKPLPDWLTEYNEKADCSPSLFGLPQLLTAPLAQPVAIVEAPKTAVVCTPYFPGLVWLAACGLSYLNAERLAPLRGRKIILFPDLNAYYDRINDNGQLIKGWATRADELRTKGFQVEVSDYLEQIATADQKAAGLDLADFILMPAQRPQIVTRLIDWKPGSILRPDESQLERLTLERCEVYPPEWDR